MERIWYYAQGEDRKGPLTTTEMKALLASGDLPAATLVWSEGMPNWQPASATELPGSQPTPTAAPPQAIATPPRAVPVAATAPGGLAVPEGLRSWMQFCGVMLIIMGALQCLTCVGIIYGLPVLLAGVGFSGAASQLGDRGLAVRPQEFLLKLRSGFKSMGIAMIIALVLMLLVFLLYATIGLALFANVAESMPEISN